MPPLDCGSARSKPMKPRPSCPSPMRTHIGFTTLASLTRHSRTRPKTKNQLSSFSTKPRSITARQLIQSRPKNIFSNPSSALKLRLHITKNSQMKEVGPRGLSSLQNQESKILLKPPPSATHRQVQALQAPKP